MRLNNSLNFSFSNILPLYLNYDLPIFINKMWVIILFVFISALTQVELEPAGQWFHQYEYSRIHGSSHEINSTENSSDESKDREHKNFAIEDDITFLRSLDPVKWKVTFISYF